MKLGARASSSSGLAAGLTEMEGIESMSASDIKKPSIEGLVDSDTGSPCESRLSVLLSALQVKLGSTVSNSPDRSFCQWTPFSGMTQLPAISASIMPRAKTSADLSKRPQRASGAR